MVAHRFGGIKCTGGARGAVPGFGQGAWISAPVFTGTDFAHARTEGRGIDDSSVNAVIPAAFSPREGGGGESTRAEVSGELPYKRESINEVRACVPTRGRIRY